MFHPGVHQGSEALEIVVEFVLGREDLLPESFQVGGWSGIGWGVGGHGFEESEGSDTGRVQAGSGRSER
jgi:hypothetical protein